MESKKITLRRDLETEINNLGKTWNELRDIIKDGKVWHEINEVK